MYQLQQFNRSSICCRKRRQEIKQCRRSSLFAASAPTPSSTTTIVPSDALLQDIRVILVAPKTPANIGAVARAAANFEAVNVWVVAPRCEALSDEAYKVACGDAILDRLTVVDDLQTALADVTGSIGFTRRAGATRLTHASITDMLNNFPTSIPNMTLTHEDMRATAASPTQQTTGTTKEITAVVFGREESGLTEAELRLCSHACAIPTGRIQGSMNLSHAVSVVLYELYQRRLAHSAFHQADATTRQQALRGHLPSSHPSAIDLTALTWLLPVDSRHVGSTVLGTAEIHSERNEQIMMDSQQPQHVTDVEGREGQERPASTVDETLLPATAAELETLMVKLSDIARAVGLSGDDSRGGGNKGNHGRKRLAVGHARALLSRARPLQGEVRSLHGLASKVLQAVDPSNPLASSSKASSKGSSTRTD